MQAQEKHSIHLAPFEKVSIQRKFSILFLIVSIVPLVLLYYVYLQSTKTGSFDFSTPAFTTAMVFMIVGVLVGYFSIRSLLVKITNISTRNRKAIEPFLNTDIIKELSEAEDEIDVLSHSFSAVIKQLEKDIQELQETNHKLKGLDHLKDEFVSVVSHEFRLPMAIIQESINQITEGMYGPVSEQQMKYLNMCLRNLERLGGLIDNLLDLSKIEDGKIEIVRTKIDMVGLIKEVVSDLSDKAEKKGLSLKAYFPHENIDVYADRDKVIQVLINLISNACKFTQKGAIEVSLSEKPGHIECCVADSGIGIDEENLPNLFSKFYQVKNQAGFGEKGSGLGLVICKHIIELHNGQIFVESVKFKGTKITFTLPRRAQ